MLISHTHWDREWYLPFQEFRFRLVQAIDEVLDLLAERPDYLHFTLDGQTVLLEDYLEIRPERRAELERLVREERLSIGPWYVLPDQFLVSPEALVRNLLVGHELAEQFGGGLGVGYLPDPFGHVSQLPQLLRGFGIDSAVLWRGVGDVQGSELTWAAPDGSKVLLVYLTGGYNNAAVLPAPEDGLIRRVRQLAVDLRERAATEYLVLMNGDDHALPQRNVPALIAHANPLLEDAELVHGSLEDLVGGIRQSIAAQRRVLPELSGELRSSRFSPLLPGVLSARMWLKQRNAACETLLERWAEPFSVLADLAEGRAEQPGSREQGFLRTAWRHLLQNHPHDSITGCSIDQVHDENRVRFDWVEQIGGSVTADALGRIAARVDTRAPESAAQVAQTVVVFNPEAHERTELVTATVAAPEGRAPALVDEQGREVPSQVLASRETVLLSETISLGQLRGLARVLGATGVAEWSEGRVKSLLRMARLLSRGRVPNVGINSFSMSQTEERGVVSVSIGATPDGQHDFDVVKVGLTQIQRLLMREDVDFVRVTISRCDEVEVGFAADAVPGLGYRTFYVSSRQPSARSEICSPDPLSIENAFFRVTAEPELGTLSVLDKSSGLTVHGLNRFEDQADAGDEYNFSVPERDWVVGSPSRPPRILVLERGPARATLLVEQVYALPVSLTDDRRGRSEQTVDCLVRSLVRLSHDVRRVDVQTEFTNLARDHRLRVLFPSGTRVETSHAESAFWVEERPVALPGASTRWAEQPVGTHPQRRFADLSDGQRGLLVGVKGLPEYEVVDTADGSALALTLLRCVGWLSRGDLRVRPGHAGPMLETPGAQCLGTHRFEYCLVPHKGDWQQAYQHAHHFGVPMRALVETVHAGELPPSWGFVALEGRGVVLSALKPAQHGPGLVARVYNTSPHATRATLTLGFSLSSVERLDLAERRTGEVGLSDPGRVELPLSPGEIVTLRMMAAGS